MAIPPHPRELIYWVNVIPIKIPAVCFIDTDKQILQFTWKQKKSRVAKTILKKNKVGGLSLPNSRVS